MLFAAEDRAEVERDVNAIIARVGQHMLYWLPGRTPRAPLQRFDLVSVRRSLAAAFHPSRLSTPANGRIRSREEDH